MNQSESIYGIWNNFKAGNKEAFASLYTIFVDTLYFYGSKLCTDESLVKDAIQEVFLDLYLKREKNKTNPANLKFYLFLALKRNLIKKIKKDRKLSGFNPSNDWMFEPEYSIEKTIIEKEKDNEIHHEILKILKNLPARQREAIYLRFNQSMEYKEIAGLLHISVESVRKQVYRALKKIRESFGVSTHLFWLIVSRKNNY